MHLESFKKLNLSTKGVLSLFLEETLVYLVTGALKNKFGGKSFIFISP